MKISQQQKQQFIADFEGLLEKLSIPVRYEKGNFTGGICTYNNETHFIMNKNLSIDRKLEVVKSELNQMDLSDLYIRPALRDFIENNHTKNRNTNGQK